MTPLWVTLAVLLLGRCATQHELLMVGQDRIANDVDRVMEQLRRASLVAHALLM